MENHPHDPSSASPSWLVMADDFSWQGWRHEGARRIRPPRRLWSALRWRRMLARPQSTDPRFVLLESCWHGFRAPTDYLDRPRQLARAFRSAGVPVVFWNKEDPFHFERFLPVALECDVVLTTDAGCLERYREAGFRGPIEPMMFAAQPRIHRPYAPKRDDRSVFFAGTLRAHHEDRLQGFRDVVLPALPFGLEIFSRSGDWPVECRPRVRGSLAYLKLLRAYSEYLIGLNISSVKHSETMFPRRVVEMIMADIFVVSDRCRALTALFPEIPQSDGPERTRDLLTCFLGDPAARADIVRAVRRRIEDGHTCAHRVRQIVSLVDSLPRAA